MLRCVRCLVLAVFCLMCFCYLFVFVCRSCSQLLLFVVSCFGLVVCCLVVVLCSLFVVCCCGCC